MKSAINGKIHSKKVQKTCGETGKMDWRFMEIDETPQEIIFLVKMY
ncbi:hypothetical protein [Hungatella sp.]|nr:hypothetical protein [Hungatella sp.]